MSTRSAVFGVVFCETTPAECLKVSFDIMAFEKGAFALLDLCCARSELLRTTKFALTDLLDVDLKGGQTNAH